MAECITDVVVFISYTFINFFERIKKYFVKIRIIFECIHPKFRFLWSYTVHHYLAADGMRGHDGKTLSAQYCLQIEVRVRVKIVIAQ